VEHFVQGLSDPEQKNIQTLCWKPFSGNTLAVGCSIGVLVWTIHLPNARDPDVDRFKGRDFRSSSVQYWTVPGLKDVSVVSFSNDGTLMAAGSFSSSICAIWNLSTQEVTTLCRDFGYTAHLAWSPDDLYLIQMLR
jgi:WD40 repeat protein